MITFYTKLDNNLNVLWFKLNYSSRPYNDTGTVSDPLPNTKIGIGIARVDQKDNYIILTKGYGRDLRNTFLSALMIDDYGSIIDEKMFCPINNFGSGKLMDVSPNSIKSLSINNTNVIGGTISDTNSDTKVFLFSFDNSFNVLNPFTTYDLDYNYTDLPSNIIEGKSADNRDYLYYSFRVFSYYTHHPPEPYDTFRNALMAVNKNDFSIVGYYPLSPVCYLFGTIGNYVIGRHYIVKSQIFLSQPSLGFFNLGFSGYFYDAFDHTYRTNPTLLQFNEARNSVDVRRYNQVDEPGNLLQCEVLSNLDIIQQIVDVNTQSTRLIKSDQYGVTDCSNRDSMTTGASAIGIIQYLANKFSSPVMLDFDPDVLNEPMDLDYTKCTGIEYKVANNAENIADNNTNNITIHPNPVNDELWITAPVGSTISLYSADSKLLLTKQATTGKSAISFSNYANGIYFLKVYNGKTSYFEKIIK